MSGGELGKILKRMRIRMRMMMMMTVMRMESENRTTTTMMTMMKNMLMTASTLAAYAANQVQCDALYQCLAGVVPDRCGCCQVPLNVTTIIIFFSMLMAWNKCGNSN